MCVPVSVCPSLSMWVICVCLRVTVCDGMRSQLAHPPLAACVLARECASPQALAERMWVCVCARLDMLVTTAHSAPTAGMAWTVCVCTCSR